MKGFETVVINVKTDIPSASLIQAIKCDYRGMRVYYSGDRLFYLFSDFAEYLGFKLRPNPEIRYFLDNGTELIDYRSIAMQIMLYIESKEVNMTDGNKKKLEVLTGAYNAYCKTPIEIIRKREEYVVRKER